MHLLALACLVFLAPGKTYELKYRFTKGMVYEDVQERVFRLTVTEEGRVLKWHRTRLIKLRRTILEVDETAHPMAERVRVLQFHLDIAASPKQEEVGVRREACEGNTFLWRRLKTRWGLFDDSGEVTAKHKLLVEQLKNWRDARLPKEPQAVGGVWEVEPKKFLQTAGLQVPKGVQGIAQFTLQKVERGTATIPFRFRYGFKDGANRLAIEQKGIWEFDVTRGRDLSFQMTGEVLINGGKGGRGELKLRRKVTYSR